VGVRLPEGRGIAVQMIRRVEGEEKDWVVHFDYSLKKLSGVGTIPRESVIYTEIFKVRPDVNAVVHCHAPMCIALSLADRPIDWVHMQSSRFKGGTPIFPRPIYILDESEGAALATALGGASAIMIKGHGIVTVGATIDEACMNTVYMERTAKIMAIAWLPGTDGGVDSDFNLQQSQAFQAPPRRAVSFRRVELLCRQNQERRALDKRLDLRIPVSSLMLTREMHSSRV
jgi:hypothetical protein